MSLSPNHLSRWKTVLHDRLRERAYPLFVFEEGVIPAATVWTGARLWTRAFRESGLTSGDRVVLALPPSAAFVQVLVAALWEDLTIAIAPPPADAAGVALLQTDLDACVVITRAWEESIPLMGVGHWQAHWCEGPQVAPLAVARFAPTPDIRFLLRTSGTTGTGRWIALTDASVWSNLDSHLPLLSLQEARSRVLSMLPWHHVFGLILDLLPALLHGAEIVRDPHSGRDTKALLELAAHTHPTHLNSVPLVCRRLLAWGERGIGLLQSLEGGIVGGAPVDAALAEALATTRLRVGYGQTEASPGIALGGPGEWPGANFLGRSLGCETRVDPKRGELHFRGHNACAGRWHPGSGLERSEAEHWIATGDLVSTDATGRLFFCGRTDDAFKLANGSRIEAGALEIAVKEAFPGIVEAFLASPDGERLTLFVETQEGFVVPSAGEAATALGAAGRLLTRVVAADHAAWVLTPKGVLDRIATRARLGV